MKDILSFVSSVMAGVVANFISKWLDRRKKKKKGNQPEV